MRSAWIGRVQQSQTGHRERPGWTNQQQWRTNPISQTDRLRSRKAKFSWTKNKPLEKRLCLITKKLPGHQAYCSETDDALSTPGMFAQTSREAVSETVFVKHYQKIIPWEKRLFWREIKGYLISVSFNASMSNYSRGDWRQANLHRPHIFLGMGCNIREHGWLVRKTGAVGEQNNNDEETWKETFRRRRWGGILCLWFHSVECTLGSWVIFETCEFPAAHMPVSEQLACCPRRPSMLLLSNQCWESKDHRRRQDTQEERGSIVKE